MKAFNDTEFLLQSDYGKRLYHNVAVALPVIDPHNHIDTASLVNNKKFDNIYQLWVKDDPYKHRAMRIFGIAEAFITGNKPDYEKFLAWAECFPSTIGNPLFHWSCMELKELFGIEEILTIQNARVLWDKINSILQEEGFGALDVVKSFGVELLCTSDDLLDSLEHHITLDKQNTHLTCLPSLRSDSIITFNTSFYSWLEKLQTITAIEIKDLSDYKNAINLRLDFFDASGCILSDHSLDSGFNYISTTIEAASKIFADILHKEPVSDNHIIRLQSHLLIFLGKEYAKRNWKMQLHIGAYRYTSSVLRNKVGPAGGYACIGNSLNVTALCSLMDELDKDNNLPKTILYTLNPADNAMFASITGSFSQDGIKGKIQYGAAWWYNDNYDGIHQQLSSLTSFGLLATSIGFTTDSRSILSFIRHKYYRRILCNLIGTWVEEGKLPDDWDLTSALVKGISYYNIKTWLQNE
jgi:glucuronate isomerase